IDLVDKAFAAGRPVTAGKFPELAIGRAEFDGEMVVTTAGPGAEILFAKVRLLDRVETERLRGFARAARGTANRECIHRQSCFQRGKGSGIAEIGRRVGAMNDAARSVDRRVPDQPEICFRAQGCANRAASRTRIAVSATCSAPPSTSPVWPPICRSASHAMAKALTQAASAAYNALLQDCDSSAIPSARPKAIAAVAASGWPALRANPSLRA